QPREEADEDFPERIPVLFGGRRDDFHSLDSGVQGDGRQNAYKSRSLASLARSVMNRYRAAASFPISSERTRSASRTFGTVTFSARRRRGSSVVDLSCSGIISPRPLKRMISGFTFFGSLARRASRSASSSGQCVSFAASIR